MNFELTSEQQMLQDSLMRLLADRERAHSGSSWNDLMEMGLLGIAVPEDRGGIGAGAVEAMIIAEALGYHLSQEPFISTALLSTRALTMAGGTQAETLLPAIAAGEMRIAFAHAELQARHCLPDVATTAVRTAGEWKLVGAKYLVADGPVANCFIVSARVTGDQRDEDGLALFVVPADAKGLAREDTESRDGTIASHLRLDAVSLSDKALLGNAGEAFPIIEAVYQTAIATQCAEAVGVMARLYGLTVEYLKTRKQFGVAIGSFQALQHRVAEMLVALEQARSMALLATLSREEEDSEERRKIMSAAKIQVSRSARFIGRQAVQLHGGIGLTVDTAVGRYYRRITAIELLLGTAEHHLDVLARAGGLFAPSSFSEGRAA